MPDSLREAVIAGVAISRRIPATHRAAFLAELVGLIGDGTGTAEQDRHLDVVLAAAADDSLWAGILAEFAGMVRMLWARRRLLLALATPGEPSEPRRTPKRRVSL